MTATNAKLSTGALKKAINRHNWALQWCWNYEKMQAAGYAYAMVPVIKELYDDNDERIYEDIFDIDGKSLIKPIYSV